MAEFRFYMPTEDDLTPNQKIAIASNKPITIISGPPGTGKTVVSIRRLLQNTSSGKNSIFFTYMNLLKYAIMHINGDYDYIKKKITTIYRWYADNVGGMLSEFNGKAHELIVRLNENDFYFDEIIVDEGQDLFDDIYDGLESISSALFIGADNAQTLFEKENPDKVNSIKETLQTHEQKILERNFRNTYEIFNFASYFFPNERIKLMNTLKSMPRGGGDKPEIHIVANDRERDILLKKILAVHKNSRTIGVLLNTVSEVNSYYNVFTNNYGVDCSMWHNNHQDTNTKLKSIIITTFKSAKGVEFDVVIIPKFHNLRQNNNSEKDNIKEHYVGVTRAKSFVYLISYNYAGVPGYVLNNFDGNSYKVL